MANKANLKTYPKVFIQQQNYGAGYAQVPNGVACNRGIWGKVSHKHFRIWVGLRSLKPRPRGYSKTEICRLLNIDRRNGLRDLEAMERKGLIEIDRNFLTAVDPDHGANESPAPVENKETTEQPTAKKENEEKEEENSQPTVLTAPPSGAVTVEATPRPRKIKRDQPSAAIVPGLNPQDLAEAWNDADGIGLNGVNAGAFRGETAKYIIKFCKEWNIEPVEFVGRVAKNLYKASNPRKYDGATPSFVFNGTGGELHKGLFYDEIRLVRQQREQQRKLDLCESAYKGHEEAAKWLGSPPQPRERMYAGWDKHAAPADYVLATPGDVIFSLNILVRKNPEAILKGANSELEKHHRYCDHMKKTWYIMTKNVGVKAIGEYQQQAHSPKRFGDPDPAWDALLEATNWDAIKKSTETGY